MSPSNITLLKYLFTLGGTAGKATPPIFDFAPAPPIRAKNGPHRSPNGGYE
jgi:hypothetical protein